VSRIGTDNGAAQTVNLTSSDTTRATVPATVVIPAGQSSATFSIGAVNDPAINGPQNVGITATVPLPVGFTGNSGFGTSGTVAASNQVIAVAVQSDGKIVSAGTNQYGLLVLSRYNARGQPDTGFGGTGTVTSTVPIGSGNALAIQPDGKIVVGGRWYTGSVFEFILARFNTDGTLDASFGTNGEVVTQFNNSGAFNDLTSLLIESDGKILAGGDIGKYVAPGSANPQFSIVRYNANGTLDTTFGSGGVASTLIGSIGGEPYAMAFQGNGILLVGQSDQGVSTAKFALARFTGNGFLDTSFGSGGVVQTSISPGYAAAKGVVIQPNGEIVVAGYVGKSATFPTPYNVALARYTSPGTLDTTFGNSGIVVSDFGGQNDQAFAVAENADGSFDVAGRGGPLSAALLARYSGGGTLEYSTSANGSNTEANGVVALGDGRVFVASQGTSAFDYSGHVDSFVNSTTNATATANVGVADVGTGLPPSAFSDLYTLNKNQAITIPASSGVLANDLASSGGTLTASLVSPSAHGTVTLNGDGSFSYWPAANYFGADTFTYKANDGQQDSNVATVTLQVNNVIHPPVAVNDTYIVQGGSLSVPASGVLANDSDPDGNPLSAYLVQGPSSGQLNLNPDGSFTYTPNAGFSGTATFTYKAADVNSNTTAVVTLDIPVANAPVALPDSYTASKNTTLTVAVPGVLANDRDPNGLTLTPTLVGSASHGTVTLNADGSFSFTPAANYLGPAGFSYSVSDGSLNSFTTSVLINVGGPDDPPVAKPDTYSINENTTLTTTPIGSNGVNASVLLNDSDPNGQAITAVLVSGPSHGSLVFNPDGTFTYTPVPYFWGTDTFTYVANDGQLNSAVATATITVNHVNHPPVAVAESYTTPEDSVLTVAAPGVLANDSDPDGDPIRAYLLQVPNQGTLNLNTNGSFTYTPALHFSGTVSFEYYVLDSYNASSNIVIDTITVTPVDYPPVANNDAYTVQENTTLTTVAGTTSLVLNSQPGDYLGGGVNRSFGATDGTYTLVGHTLGPISVYFGNTSGTESWSLTFAAPNGATLGPGTYTGATRYLGVPSSTPGLDITGDSRGSNTLTGQFTVTQALYDSSGNIYAFAASFVDHNEGLTPALIGSVAYQFSFSSPPGVLVNDTDVEKSPLTAALVSGPSHGSLTFYSDGSFSYTPAANYLGPDSFTYKANDGQSYGNTATATINVIPPDHPPVAVPETYNVAVGSTLSVPGPGILGNDSDPDGDPITPVLMTPPKSGSLTLNPDGSFSYTPNAGFVGTDHFDYYDTDGKLNGNFVTDTINVVRPPVAGNDAYTLAGGSTLTTVAGVTSLTLNNTLRASTITFGPGDGSFGGQTSTPGNVVTVNFGGTGSESGENWSLYFATANGAPMVPGTYTNVAGIPAPAGRPTLSISGDGVGYSTLGGQFTVTQVVYDGSGHLLSFDATFDQKWSTVNPDITGRVQYQATNGQTGGVLLNDSDPSHLPLTAALVSGPAHGTLSLQSDGSFTYTPTPGFSGSDSFTYTASNGLVSSNVATVSILVGQPTTDQVWVDDNAPAGATLVSDGGDSWTWAATNPAPYSGALDLQSSLAAGEHEIYFYGYTSTPTVPSGGSLFAYVYLDPANPPSEVMLQWNVGGSWEHRAYWGANAIPWGTDGTVSRQSMGALPATGGWVRLAVPASLVGLDGQTLLGMAFTLFGGRAAWDDAGVAPPPPAASNAWVDDTYPAGAVTASDGPSWTWAATNPPPFSGNLDLQAPVLAGEHQQYFFNAANPLSVPAGGTLSTYVYLDPANPPSEVMLQWNVGGSWEHRAYWGANAIPWGTDGTASRYSVGALPAAGGWVQLAVPAALVGLDGQTVMGMAFTLYDGRAAFDHAGVAPSAGSLGSVDDLAPAGATLASDGEDS
jgi:uncharacterized delta-60 repeat protein